MVSGVSLLSLGMFSSFVHVVAFLLANNIPLKGSTTFLYPSVDEHLSCYHFWAIMNNDAMNIHVLLLQFVGTYGDNGNSV